MDQPKIHADDRMRWRMLAYLSIALVFSWSTWFSAIAVIPQLSGIWELSPSAAARLTIAVQLGFVVGAAVANALLLVADGVEFGKIAGWPSGFLLPPL
jgi:hypothetical protein